MTAHCKPDPTEYAPYHLEPKFWQGVADDGERFVVSDWTNEAYAKGREYAWRLARWVGSKEVVR